MMTDPGRDETVALAALARRAYERGRFFWALRQSLLVTALVGAVGLVGSGRDALFFLPLPLLGWLFAAYRGGAFQAGALRGVGAGIAALLVPLAWLRPCCAAGAAGAACCAAPGACLAGGALLGGAFALLLPRVRGARRLEAAAGLMLGVLSVGALRCPSLLVGETLGLVVGLAGGLTALAAARAFLDRSRA